MNFYFLFEGYATNQNLLLSLYKLTALPNLFKYL